MAYRIDPEVRVFSIDTGRLPQETFDLIEALRERYEGLRLELLSPDAGQVQRLVDLKGPNLFRTSVENRLLCCNVRKVQPLTRALAGLDAWVTGLRRDQWASRSDIRKVEIDHDHGAIVKLNPLAEWSEDEVWDYLRENDVPTTRSTSRATRRSAARRARGRWRRASRCGQGAGGGRPTRRRSAGCIARSRPAASSTSCTRSSGRAHMSETLDTGGDPAARGGGGACARRDERGARGGRGRGLSGRARRAGRGDRVGLARRGRGGLARADRRARAADGPSPRHLRAAGRAGGAAALPAPAARPRAAAERPRGE